MSDTTAPLLLDIADGIARLRFNRPAGLNAIDRPMAICFHDACQTLQQTPDLRAVVISGEGKAFMAGGDLASFHAGLPNASAAAKAIIDPVHAGLNLLTQLPQPVIASLHGAVAGAGVSIALACDFAIAADNARFALAYSRIGTSLDAGCTWSLPRIVGLRKALELSLLADPFDAAEALRLGLINRVVPFDTLANEVDALAQRLAAGPTVAYGRIKQLLRASHGTPFAEQLDAEQAAFCACATTEDFAEGLNAFFDKRPARFRGR